MSILAGFAVTDGGAEYFGHIRDTRRLIEVTSIVHPSNASRGKSVEFEIHTYRNFGSLKNSYLKLRGHFLTKTVSGDFYWYEEWGMGYFPGNYDIKYNFTLVFSLAGTWTIDINGYTTTITIL